MLSAYLGTASSDFVTDHVVLNMLLLVRLIPPMITPQSQESVAPVVAARKCQVDDRLIIGAIAMIVALCAFAFIIAVFVYVGGLKSPNGSGTK
jgi:hypothetical protein